MGKFAVSASATGIISLASSRIPAAPLAAVSLCDILAVA